MPLLFVYGTLMYGMPSHGLLAGSFFAGRGYVRGVLHECDGYPLLVTSGSGVVWGELYYVASSSLTRIDYYEGAGSPQSPWQRRRVEVHVNGVSVKAYAYVAALDEARERCARLEELGVNDYRLVAGGGPPRWLLALPEEAMLPPGLVLGSERGRLEGLEWGGRCFTPNSGEPVTIYDLLASPGELREWAESLGCELRGARARIAELEVYPYAPLAPRG